MFTIEGPGEYYIVEDIQGDVTIKGEGAVVYGNLHCIQGKLYVSGKNITIYDLIVAPPWSPNFTESVVLDNCNNVLLKNVKVQSPVPMDYFASCSSDSIQFSNCQFNGAVFNDSPESIYIKRF